MTTFALCDGMTDIRRLQSRVSGIAPHVQVVAQVLAASVVGVLEGAVVGPEVERHLLVHLVDVVLISLEPLQVQLVSLLFVHLRKLLPDLLRILAPQCILIIDAWNGESCKFALVQAQQEDLRDELRLHLLALLDGDCLGFEAIQVRLIASDVGQEDVASGGLVQIGRNSELKAATLVAQRRLALHS